MSKIGKRKQLNRAHLDIVYPNENQSIAKILHCPGNNLYEVLNEDKEQFLVSLPTIFRKSVMLVRGDYVLLQPIEENNKDNNSTSKVKAEIVTIYMKTQIKLLQKEGKFPKTFSTEESKEEEDDIYNFVNSNHHEEDLSEDEEETSSSEEED